MASVAGRVEDVAPGSVKAVEVEGKSIAVANLDGNFYALDDLCPHRGCSLAQGALTGTILTCPCHGSQFDVTTGAVVRGPASAGVETYSVAVSGGELRIGGEPTSTAVAAEATPAPADTGATEASVLAKVPLFSDLDPASLASLEAFAFKRAFAPGELIVEEGHTGNGLYVVISGQVEVVKGLGTQRAQTIGLLGPGEPFGEMALLGDWKRSASVRAVDEAECLGLDRWVFLAYLNREPQFAIKMLQMLAQRLAEAGQKLAE